MPLAGRVHWEIGAKRYHWKRITYNRILEGCQTLGRREKGCYPSGIPVLVGPVPMVAFRLPPANSWDQ